MNKEIKTDKKEKTSKIKKHGAHFGLEIAASVLLLFAAAAYLIGAAYFGYYSDTDPVILMLTLISILLGISVAVQSDKKGDKAVLRLLSLLVTILPIVCLMMLASARVYSIAVLLLSELERDNAQGYYALYFSIGAMGLYFIGAVCNAVSNFFRPVCYGQKEISE